MLGLKVSSGEPYTEVNAPGPSDGIIGIIGLAGAWVGTASLCCNTTMACRMSSHMLGMEYTEVCEDVLDAVSEIANMIFGNFKTSAETYLGPLGLSIPTVVFGRNFRTRSAANSEWIAMRFHWDDECLLVRLCLARSGRPAFPHVAAVAHACTLDV